MKPTISTLLAVALLLGAGATIFSVKSSSADFTGPFGGSGGGSTILYAATTVDLAAIAANSQSQAVQLTFTGSLQSDVPTCTPRGGLEPGLVVAYVYMADDSNAELYFHNATASPIDPASNTFACSISRP